MGKIVLLTGGSSGIGASAASMLCKRGHIVYSASRRGSEPETSPAGGAVIPLKLDINDETALQDAVKQILASQGRIDAVICNAGNGMAGAVEDTSDEEVRSQFETCFFGAVKTVRAVLPAMRTKGAGTIITVTSVAGFIPIPFQTLYSSVKAALLMFTKALSLEVRPFGIRCCSILPGDTKTGFTSARKYAAKADSEDSAYYSTMKSSLGKMERDEQNGMDAAVIAKAIVKQVEARKPSLVVVPGFSYKAIHILSKILPDSLVLKIVGMLYC